MASLPTVGGDNNSWGTELNDFLTTTASRSALATSPSAGATSFDLAVIPPGLVVDSYIVFDAYTTEAESRQVTAISGNTVTVAATTYDHAAGDHVCLVKNGVFHAEWFGAKFDGFSTGSATDNAPMIQAALDAAFAFSVNASFKGAIVQLPASEGRIASTITVKGGTWLRGGGIGTTVLACNDWSAVSTPAIVVDTGSQAARVSDIAIACITSSPVGADGIHVKGGSAWPGLGGVMTELHHVLVDGMGGDGIVLEAGGPENRLRDCYSAHNTGAGFNVSASDVFFSDCTADTNGGAGFLLTTSNCKLSNCKAFGNTGSGYNIGGQRNMFSSCESQDNHQYGYNDAGGDNVFAACVADTNGQAGGTQYGFYLSGASCASACLAINRSGSTQSYGYRAAIDNSTYAAIVGCTSRLPGTAHVDPASDGGSIEVNALLGLQSVAYAASITPDPYLGGHIVVGTLTGGLTINAIANPFKGMRVSFQLPQDGTGGRTVTFNAQYKTTAAIPTTLSSTTIVHFVYDGSNFRETSRATI